MNKLEFSVRKFVPKIMIQEGQPIPRFFLPVEKDGLRLGYDCYFFLFAPFVLLFKITSRIFWLIWGDFVHWLDALKSWRRK